MRSLSDLKKFARDAAALLAREKDLAAYEVYCSTGEHKVVRLNYTSDIPSRGIEEFKSLDADGFAVRIVTRRDPHETGSASVAGDLSAAAVREAIFRARHALIIDPHFPGFPTEPRRLDQAMSSGAEHSDLLRAKDTVLAATAWEITGGAIREFEQQAPLKLAHPGFVLGGDVSLMRDRVAITNSAFEDIRVDESAHFVSPRRTARCGPILRSSGSPTACRDPQLRGDAVAHHSRILCGEFGLSGAFRRRGNGYTSIAHR